MVFRIGLQMGEGFAGFAKNLLLPVEQLLLEVLELSLVHKRLVLGRTIDALLD